MTVINLSEYKKSDKAGNISNESFDSIIQKNADNLDRIRQERQQDNNSALRSHRLRNVSSDTISRDDYTPEKKIKKTKKKSDKPRKDYSIEIGYGEKWYFRKTKNKYVKNSKLFFDANTCRAYSYNWWRFVDCIAGMVVFNDYTYSSSTTGHQSSMRNLLFYLGIKINYRIEAPNGLDDLDAAKTYYQHKINDLEKAIAKPQTHKRKNLERLWTIVKYEEKINLISDLMELRNQEYIQKKAM